MLGVLRESQLADEADCISREERLGPLLGRLELAEAHTVRAYRSPSGRPPAVRVLRTSPVTVGPLWLLTDGL